jgi:hypothetical protein
MKILISLTIIATMLFQVKPADGVDPTPAKVPIQVSNEQKVNVAKIMNILKQQMPETSKFNIISNLRKP